DVRELQVLLNQDPATRVAEAGPGSPGNETEYFGPLTHDAVLRLQRKYALDILAPIGLSAPTGIVASQTRLFLLRLVPDKTPPVATSQAAPPMNVRPKIISIFPAVITKSTAEVTITGENFTATGNTVLVSSELSDAFTNLSSSDGKTLRFTFRFTAAETLKAQVREAASASGESYEAVVAVVAANVQQTIDGPKTSRIPVIVAVRNSNGESNPVELMTDIAAILNDVGN
ncbi:MAG: peptidoglycan-binding domain-containing protein, partial [Patescibacteria group bacterium]